MNKLFSALSLCRRARALTCGFDAVKDDVMRGKAALVLTAADLSPKTQQRVERFCQELAPLKTLPLAADELLAITRKPTAVFAVTDENLAALVEKNLEGGTL